MSRTTNARNARVMVFGVFDRLHDGHRSFLKQARKHGSELIVVVARDSVAAALKQKTPRESERTRTAALRRVPGVWKVILGDRAQGSYGVIKKWRPEAICLGYDQKKFSRDITKKTQDKKILAARIITLKAYRPQRFHTRILTS